MAEELAEPAAPPVYTPPPTQSNDVQAPVYVPPPASSSDDSDSKHDRDESDHKEDEGKDD